MTAPILVALDTPTSAEAIELAEAVAPFVAGYKVGLELLMGSGPDIVSSLATSKPVFADAKLHDIPNTVHNAARQLGKHGARWVTVHAAGGRAMMAAAVEGLNEGAGDRSAGVLAVTVLTSLSESDLDEIGMRGPAGDRVSELARLASSAGVEGVVCSPLEIARVRETAPGLSIVVPGIRPAGAETHDQARVSTPEAALALGATYLVIGRAITAAPDPVVAARDITSSIVDRGPVAG